MEPTNIYQRLHAAMEQVQYVQKEAKKNGMQYTFVSHDAVTAKVRPALLDNGIVPTVSVKHHSQDGNRTEVVLVVRFVNIDKPEDFVEVEAFGYGIDPQDKGPGKAISYAFKYACLKTLCLETGDDPERDQIDHEDADTVRFNKRKPVLTAGTQNAIALFAKGDDFGAYGEIMSLFTGPDDTEARLFVNNLLREHSALRASLKKHAEREREMERMTAEPA